MGKHLETLEITTTLMRTAIAHHMPKIWCQPLCNSVHILCTMENMDASMLDTFFDKFLTSFNVSRRFYGRFFMGQRA